MDLRQRFEQKIKINSESGCWEWTAHLDKGGYGTFKLNYKKEKAHRVSYILYKGEIQNGLLVCHKCDNRKCVNPDHLFLGTVQDNMNDMFDKNRKTRAENQNCPSKLKYNKGICRCELCKKAATSYQMEVHKKAKLLNPDILRDRMRKHRGKKIT